MKAEGTLASGNWRETFALVALKRPLGDAFTYRAPEGLWPELAAGRLVQVPFGNSQEVGVVVGGTDDAGELDETKIRALNRIVSPDYRIGKDLIDLARFVADYYFCSLGEALSAVSMTGLHDVRVSRVPYFRLAGDWLKKRDGAELTPRQEEVCRRLEELGHPSGSRQILADLAGCSTSVIGKLHDAGLLEPAEPDLPAGKDGLAAPDVPHALVSEQRDALEAILRAVEESYFRVFLLHGITGSGKTEVYLQAMASVLEKDRCALCLVPEISLTPQTVQRFESRFQSEMGVYHSQMTLREKLILYRKIETGRIRIVIGARSAIFAPLPRLGLIVIDEEHDGSYKQGETPRYNARDIGIVRAQRLKIPIVLGSATPSMESYENAAHGKYHLLTLPARALGAKLPPVQVIDLARAVSGEASLHVFSPALRDAIQERLDRKEQSLLFLNRRGFSNFLFCPSCKWVARCEEDDVSMTLHRLRRPGREEKEGELDLFREDDRDDESFLKCHFCGASRPAPAICPECREEGLVPVGSGTQRIERELEELFPKAKILRLDYDTTKGKGEFEKAWQRMVSGEADIILGTQMIAKGLHLERVTLVGVVLADVGLFIPDFRAEERTFSVLTQVAGRSGRVSAGDVILQTYMPQHPAVRFAAEHDYAGFFAGERRRRLQWGFPPFTRMIALTLSHPDRDRAFAAARLLVGLLWRYRHRRGCEGTLVNGPTVAPLARLGGRYRYRILARAKAPRNLRHLLKGALGDPEWQLPSGCRLAVDVDPLDLL